MKFEKQPINRIAMLQLYYIRDTAETDMFEINTVFKIAKRHNFAELQEWIITIGDSNYASAIITGVFEEKVKEKEEEPIVKKKMSKETEDMLIEYFNDRPNRVKKREEEEAKKPQVKEEFPQKLTQESIENLRINKDKKTRNYFTKGDETATDKDRKMRDYFSDLKNLLHNLQGFHGKEIHNKTIRCSYILNIRQ